MKAQRIDFDFAPAAHHRQPLGLALLGSGVLAALFGAFLWTEAWSAQVAQTHTLATLDNEEATAASRSSRPTPATPGELANNRAALNVARGLQTPWSDLLTALESAPRNNVALLGIEPSIAITKEIELTFVFGYAPEEFAATLHNLAEGVIDVSGLVTGKVGLGGVADAFTALGDPEAHVKILVDPAS